MKETQNCTHFFSWLKKLKSLFKLVITIKLQTVMYLPQSYIQFEVPVRKHTQRRIFYLSLMYIKYILYIVQLGKVYSIDILSYNWIMNFFLQLNLGFKCRSIFTQSIFFLFSTLWIFIIDMLPAELDKYLWKFYIL